MAPDFWDTVDPAAVLTHEESAFLASSATDRYSLAEEIVLCKKMLQLLDMASEQRRAAVAARSLESDGCGYDARLDSVGAQHAFAAFVKSPAGEAVFTAGKLTPPTTAPPPALSQRAEEDGAEGKGDGAARGGEEEEEEEGRMQHVYAGVADPLGGGMCERRRCKPHAGWYNTLARAIRHQMKELAAQAGEKLDAEARVREGAAVRYRRKAHERNWVAVLDESSDDDDDDDDDGGDEDEGMA